MEPVENNCGGSSNPFNGNYNEKLVPFVKNMTVSLESLIEANAAQSSSVSVAIDAPYGVGKTTLVGMWSDWLNEEKDMLVVKFDAWKYDFYDEPFEAVAATIIQGLKGVVKSDLLENTTNSARKYGVGLLKAGGRFALNVMLEHARAQDATKEFKADLVDMVAEINGAYQLPVDEADEFHKDLKALIGDKKLFVFIDELDRCRPDFMLKLLERVKHIFNIPSTCYVFTTTRGSLAATIAKEYGFTFKQSEDYLERFFDLVIPLPVMCRQQYLGLKFSQLEQTEYLDSLFERYIGRKAAECLYQFIIVAANFDNCVEQHENKNGLNTPMNNNGVKKYHVLDDKYFSEDMSPSLRDIDKFVKELELYMPFFLSFKERDNGPEFVIIGVILLMASRRFAQKSYQALRNFDEEFLDGLCMNHKPINLHPAFCGLFNRLFGGKIGLRSSEKDRDAAVSPAVNITNEITRTRDSMSIQDAKKYMFQLAGLFPMVS